MTLLTPERVASIFGLRWVIRRAEDGRIEYGGFTSLDEAERFLTDLARAAPTS